MQRLKLAAILGKQTRLELQVGRSGNAGVVVVESGGSALLLPAAIGTGGRISLLLKAFIPSVYMIFLFYLAGGKCTVECVVTAAAYDHAECIAAKRRSQRNGDKSPVI